MSDYKIKEESKGCSITEESFIKGFNSKDVKDKLSESKHIYKTGNQTPKKLKKRIKKEIFLSNKKKSSSKFCFIDHDSSNLGFFNILNKIPKAKIDQNYLKKQTKLKEEIKLFNSKLDSSLFFNNNFKNNASISIFNITEYSGSKIFKKFEKKKRSLKECAEAFENAFKRSIFSFRMHKYFLEIGDRRSRIETDIDPIPSYKCHINSRALVIDCSINFNSKKRAGLILAYSKSDPKWIFTFNEILSSNPNKLNISSTISDNLIKFWMHTNWKDIILFLIISKKELVQTISNQVTMLSNYEDLEDYICMIQNEPSFSRTVSIRTILNPHDIFVKYNRGETSSKLTVVDYKITRI